MRELEVYYNDIKAGKIQERYPGEEYAFIYYPQYLQGDYPPISTNLPKQKEPFLSQYLFPVFFNMLPEGRYRKRLCRAYKVDENDFFGVLCMMADGEFIGAVNVRKP